MVTRLPLATSGSQLSVTNRAYLATRRQQPVSAAAAALVLQDADADAAEVAEVAEASAEHSDVGEWAPGDQGPRAYLSRLDSDSDSDLEESMQL
jgi:hypothetical protein